MSPEDSPAIMQHSWDFRRKRLVQRGNEGELKTEEHIKSRFGWWVRLRTREGSRKKGGTMRAARLRKE